MINVKPLYACDNATPYFDAGTVKPTGLKADLHDFRPAAAEWKSLRLTLNPDFQASWQGNLG
jgi:hypothetical protein